jgi:hypothetical protein
VQELQHSPADLAWQRSVMLAWETPLDAAQEPRLKRLAEGTEPPGADHPFFWAGYLLVDTGTGDGEAADADANAAPGANSNAAAGAKAVVPPAAKAAPPVLPPQSELKPPGEPPAKKPTAIEAEGEYKWRVLLIRRDWRRNRQVLGRGRTPSWNWPMRITEMFVVMKEQHTAGVLFRAISHFSKRFAGDKDGLWKADFGQATAPACMLKWVKLRRWWTFVLIGFTACPVRIAVVSCAADNFGQCWACGMSRLLTDTEIHRLLAEPKKVSSGWQKRLTPLYKNAVQGRRQLTIEGDHGSKFRIDVRDNRLIVLDFSIILTFIESKESEYILTRFNGKHPSQHTNKWERKYGEGLTHFRNTFHIHTATERYQVEGFKIDGYAEPTPRYVSFDGALRCFVNTNGFYIEDVRSDYQLPFGDEQWMKRCY